MRIDAPSDIADHAAAEIKHGEETAMKIELNKERCTGHGRCYVLAPEVFDEDEPGYCVLKLETVPEGLQENARAGVDACPEHALTIVSPTEG